MILHEHQSKAPVAEYAVPIPQGPVADSPQAALSVAEDLGGSQRIVKAQVHASGRVKAAGVKVVTDLEAVLAVDVPMPGTTLAAYQTRPKSLPVRQVLAAGVKIARARYLNSALSQDAARLASVRFPGYRSSSATKRLK